MIETYKDHPSDVSIKENIVPHYSTFDLPPASKEDINKIVKLFNVDKATLPDRIPLKLIRPSVKVIDKYLTSVINHDNSRYYCSDAVKNVLVRPIYRKKDSQDMENYRPVNILNGFSMREL